MLALWVDSLLLGVALSIDAMVVSFTQGLVFTKNKRANSTLLAFFVAFFQFIMPVIGWFLAKFIYNFVATCADWIAAVIFFLLGTKFITDAIKHKDEETQVCQQATPYLSLKFLLLVSIATSIDALAVGITFAFLKVNILLSVLLIGVTTFALSLAGVLIGNKFGAKYKSKAELAGGIILVLIGVKILLEHLGVINF